MSSCREQLPRIDLNPSLQAALRPLCRLQPGEVWEDPEHGHRVGVIDATDASEVRSLFDGDHATLLVNDPPYNIAVGGKPSEALFRRRDYQEFSESWIHNAVEHLADPGHFYVWLGADYRDGFQPIPEIILLLRSIPELTPHNWITLRNQRGYGTQHNWMWVRQELLYYIKGTPPFRVAAEYTEIPRVLKGYYTDQNSGKTSNSQRSHSPYIRAGNVWVDIQQVFYRMEENVPGCYAQKPLRAVERIMRASAEPQEIVADLFAHSGTTLLAGERLGNRVYTSDRDPIFAEITIRRLENYRRTGRTGWQWRTPFPEMSAASVGAPTDG